MDISRHATLLPHDAPDVALSFAAFPTAAVRDPAAVRHPTGDLIRVGELR
ncbi:hypothetical protein [Streptomyces peucetius]|uniref:Uncharacterized protein n=1 Tax=Streptomyces peucetius TaxID=1950 RepID=A0ABY6IGQ8_STRPE|nr:hypothetical protein [Streptomyces peucetius]UYQ66181.1 hypothetical protein OGH68_35160 [Streptomyces peucetius]